MTGVKEVNLGDKVLILSIGKAGICDSAKFVESNGMVRSVDFFELVELLSHGENK